MSVVSVDFDQADSYTLERLKTPEIKLKPEQVKAIRHIYRGKTPVFVWFSNGFGKSICYLCMFDYRKSRELSTEVAALPL